MSGANIGTFANYRLYVNAERTVMVRFWDSGVVEVATRATPGDTWGPPVVVEEES